MPIPEIFPKFDSINITTLEVTAKENAILGECLRESILLAITYWIDDGLQHKNRRYRIPINYLILAGGWEPNEQKID